MNVFVRNITVVLFFCFFQSFEAQIRLPKLINDGMVLQREMPIRVWGCANSNASVSIDFIDKTYKTYANENGEWQILISPFRTDQW